MSGAPDRIESLDRLGDELARGMAAYPRRRRRRFLAALAAAVLVVPAGVVSAQMLIDENGDPIPIGRRGVVTVGFKDPATGEEVRCPDGELLTQTIRGIEIVGNTPQEDPVCSDGTTPGIYLESKELQEDFIENAPVGTDLSTAPGLRSFVIGGGEGEGE